MTEREIEVAGPIGALDGLWRLPNSGPPECAPVVIPGLRAMNLQRLTFQCSWLSCPIQQADQP